MDTVDYKDMLEKNTLVTNCRNKQCSHYATCCRLNTEYYDDNNAVDILFVGQGAGKVEAQSRRPFVGPAGKRLRELISYIWDMGVHFTVGFSNTVRCHPIDENGKDRVPNQNEIDSCISLLENDIRTISPRVIMPLGASATKAVIPQYRKNQFVTMSKVHGEASYDGINVYVPTYHPSYLIRHNKVFDRDNISNEDRIVLDDIKMVLKYLKKKRKGA
tara:strand:- start:2125 stop:2775 length:651 start_codon:yes stop_codon:yes gene_type:complete